VALFFVCGSGPWPRSFNFTHTLHTDQVINFQPCFSGPAGFPQSGTRLIVTGLDGLLSVQPSIFILENRPGRNPSLGGEKGWKLITRPVLNQCANSNPVRDSIAQTTGSVAGQVRYLSAEARV